MNVLGLSGSPRMGGNTEQLLYEVLRGAREAGAESRLIEIADLDISGCLHCDYCSRTGDCKINDDMRLVYDALSAADRVVIASPLHFMTVTAQLKAAIDRCQCLWARKFQLKLAPIEPAKPRKGFFHCRGRSQGPEHVRVGPLDGQGPVHRAGYRVRRGTVLCRRR